MKNRYSYLTACRWLTSITKIINTVSFQQCILKTITLLIVYKMNDFSIDWESIQIFRKPFTQYCIASEIILFTKYIFIVKSYLKEKNWYLCIDKSSLNNRCILLIPNVCLTRSLRENRLKCREKSGMLILLNLVSFIFVIIVDDIRCSNLQYTKRSQKILKENVTILVWS